MAGGAFPRPVEVGLPGFRIAHQWIDGTGALSAAADRNAVEKSGDGAYLFCGEIELRHAFVGTAVLYNCGNEFSILIVQDGLAADQIWAAFAAACVRSVAKAAVGAENLTALLHYGRIGRRPGGIGTPKGRLGWRRRLVRNGSLWLLCDQSDGAKPEQG